MTTKLHFLITRLIATRIIVLFIGMVIILGACSSELSDEDAKKLAISKYVNSEMEKLKTYSGGNPVNRNSVGRVKEATVLENDGITARVKLELSLKKSLPSNFVEIEITKEH